MFERALRKQFRYESTRGYLTTEQLWDLSLEDLDLVAQGVNEELEKSKTKSFIKKESTASKDLSDKLEVLKYIIKVKLEEVKASEDAEVRRQKVRRIEEIIQTKKESELESKSLEELSAMLEELK